MDEIYNRTNSLSLELDEIIDRRNFLPDQYCKSSETGRDFPHMCIFPGVSSLPKNPWMFSLTGADAVIE